MTLTLQRRAPTPITPGERPPNRVAEQITGRNYLSHSQLSTMRACPKRYSLHYAEHARPDFVASSLILGGSVHSALEAFMRGRLEGITLLAEDLLAAYHDAWNHQRQETPDVPVRFNKGETQETVDALAGRMLLAFLASPLAHPKGTILGIEEQMRIVLDPDLPDLLAKVDLVTQTPNAMHVVDFKTSRSRWNPQKAQESGDQLLLYGITVARMSGPRNLPVQLHFAVITKAVTGAILAFPNFEHIEAAGSQ